MFGRILLTIRIALPFILNILLFLWIYNLNKGKEFALTDSLFYVGIISFFYGVGFVFLTPKKNFIYMMKQKHHGINTALSEQHIKNYHKGKDIYSQLIKITPIYIKLIYIILGILLCVSSGIVYFI